MDLEAVRSKTRQLPEAALSAAKTSAPEDPLIAIDLIEDGPVLEIGLVSGVPASEIPD